MKKLSLISALSLGLVVLAWCTTSKPVAITSSDDRVNLYNESKAMTCTMKTVTDGNTIESTIYFKDWMIEESSVTTTSDWEISKDYALARDGMMYGWWDSYWDGWVFLEYDMDIEEELWDFVGVEEGETLTCTKWVKDASIFDKPADIEFVSINDLFWNIDYDEEYYGDEYSEEPFEENSEENVVEENNEEVVLENEDNWDLGWEDGLQ